MNRPDPTITLFDGLYISVQEKAREFKYKDGNFKFSQELDKCLKFEKTYFSKKILSAPPSSVMSERLFSTMGNIFDGKQLQNAI